MGQLAPALVIFAAVRILLVNGSIQDSGDEPTENARTSFGREIQEEVRLLCNELEEERYNQNRTLFKLKALPV